MVQSLLFKEDVKTGEQAVSVLVPFPVEKAYDYAVPDGMDIAVGDYVAVPLGKRIVPGVVWGAGAGDVSPAKLKYIAQVYDVPPMPAVQRDFLDWVSGYTLGARGSVLKMALSVPKALEVDAPAMGYVLLPSPRGEGAYKLTEKQRAVVDVLSDAAPRRAAEIAEAAGCTAGVIKGLVKKGVLREVEIHSAAPCRNPDVHFGAHDLSGAQAAARDAIFGYAFGLLPPPRPSPQGGEGVAHSDLIPPPSGGRLGGGAVTKDGRFLPEDLKNKSRDLRKNMTEPEKKLWFAINKEQMHGHKFRRQHPVERYIADFACLEKNLIVEVDGDTHDQQAEYDKKRTEFLESRGFQVLRFSNRDVLENLEGVVQTIYNALHAPPPRPSPQGGEEVAHSDLIPPPSGGRLGGGDFSQSPSPHKALLLDGVTGAGKTEVYFEAVAEALAQGRQVLLMLPEIALSNAFLDRFKARFGCAPALWHSQLSAGARRRTWRGVACGDTKVIVGARSALFLPYADLGLIIVDEEHDPAYKQEEGVMYHARDMAIVRGHLARIPVLLVSATPSLETMQNVWDGRYAHVELPDRFGGARLPEIQVVDMREKDQKPDAQHFISPVLKTAITDTIRSGQQCLLFLNRRGYAPLTLCRSCGHRMNCPRCSSWLVEHKRTKKLHCHHCGYHTAPPQHCPSCNEADSFAVCGPGVERIHEEAKALFPDARIMILASDTAESNEQLRAMLDDIRDGKVDIIIGTQIIAKGHHFPKLTCVGVIDADLGLGGGELRANERVYQLLHQVAGRAGREQDKGRVFLQTFMPEHKIMKALAHSVASPPTSPQAGGMAPQESGARACIGRDAFLQAEAEERYAAHMPPFSRLVGIIIAGRDEGEVVHVAKELGRTAPRSDTVQVFGPAPAPLSRLRGRYRYRLLLRANKNSQVQNLVKTWIDGIKAPSSVRVYIDIDPQSFM